MKVLFVKPPFPFMLTAPPLGPLYLSSALKKHFGTKARTRLLHLWSGSRPLDTFSRAVEQWRPDIVAITTLTGDAAAIHALSEAAHNIHDGIHVSCGGPYPTHCPEDFEQFSFVDSIMRGEGESAFVKLVDSVCGAQTANIPGVSFRNSGSLPPVAERTEPVADIDSLPFPDWSLLDFREYDRRVSMNGLQAGRRAMPVFTSRGCPYKCAYCHEMFGRRPRLRSPENVVSEIERLATDYAVDEIQFVDDIFNLDRARALEICELIIARRLKIHICFPNGLRGDRMDKELISALKKAGAYQITYAIETASPRLQKFLEKNVDIPKTVESIRETARQGLLAKSFFMIGFPTETIEEINETVRLAKSLPLHTLVFFTVVPFKGTKLYDAASQELGLNKNDAPGLHSSNYNSAIPYYNIATGRDLQKIKIRAYLSFFTPWRIARFFIAMPQKTRYLKTLAVVLGETFLPWKKKKADDWK